MTTEERFERMEAIVDGLATKVSVLGDAMTSMAESIERLAVFQETEYQPTRQQFRELTKATDERLERLVGAISELAGRR